MSAILGILGALNGFSSIFDKVRGASKYAAPLTRRLSFRSGAVRAGMKSDSGKRAVSEVPETTDPDLSDIGPMVTNPLRAAAAIKRSEAPPPSDSTQ